MSGPELIVPNVDRGAKQQPSHSQGKVKMELIVGSAVAWSTAVRLRNESRGCSALTRLWPTKSEGKRDFVKNILFTESF